MASDLEGIYAALAAMEVEIGGVVVPCRNVDALPESVAAGNCPIRLLMPWGERAGANATSILTIGDVARTDWQIVDLLLLRPAQAGKLETASAAVVQYMQAYVTALNGVRAFAGAQAINPVRITAGVGQYPAGSGAQWFGVEVTLTVRETWR